MFSHGSLERADCETVRLWCPGFADELTVDEALMVLSVLAEVADRSIQQFGKRRRWWKSRAGRPDKEGEGDHRGAPRLLGLGQSTSALYESVSAFADRPRASPSATSSSMWLTSGIAIAGNVMRQAPIANPGQAARPGCPRVEHSTLKSISSSQIVPTEQARSNEVIGPDLVTRCGGHRRQRPGSANRARRGDRH
jgi:hypothetical protein